MIKLLNLIIIRRLSSLSLFFTRLEISHMSQEILGLPGRCPSDVYPRTKKLVEEADKHLISLVTKWTFLKSVPQIEIKRFDGEEIRLGGVAFKGTVVDVFWSGFIEPYIEHESVKILEAAGQLATDCQLSHDIVTDEARMLLHVMVRRVYSKMADVDQTLRGDGFTFPEKRDVTSRIAAMSAYVDAESKIVMLKARNMQGNLQPTVHISGHANAQIQIGHDNNQVMQITLQQLVEQVAKSNDKDAKSLIQKILENNTVASIIGAAAGALLTKL